MSQLPSTTWRMLARGGAGKKLPKGLDAAWDAAAGFVGRLVPRTQAFLRRAGRVVALEKHFSEMTDARLRETADDLRAVFRREDRPPSHGAGRRSFR